MTIFTTHYHNYRRAICKILMTSLKKLNLKFPEGTFLFPIDIDSLYTNIDTNQGLQTVQQIFGQHPDPNRADEEIQKLLEINLTCNDFHFSSQFFLQVHGVVMGKIFAAGYANIYMAHWEQTLRKLAHHPTPYYRYLDDNFRVWTFKEFLPLTKQHHSTIKIKSTINLDTINILDTSVLHVFLKHSQNATYQSLTTIHKN